jgi:exodeoxyribonuclease VII large subunit
MEELTPVFKVSELNKAIKEILESSFNELWVEGEISGLKESSLGHIYFDLKDENSLISCVFFKWFANKIKFDLENGLLVRVRAQVTIYDKQSKYQLQIKEVVSLKYGPLQLAFEQLKEKLKKEGLFDESRKKRIPPFPSKIAVVTSIHGAAIRDILTILKKKYMGISILIYPVKVQGDGAAEEISFAIKDLNENFRDIDVILVGRGGGSMEDLWAFNEEIVARTIAASKIPIISCVGHETDFTIADFVADLRAATPSAAASLVVKNREELINHIANIEKRIIQSLKVYQERINNRYFRFINSRFMKNPYLIIQRDVRRFDELFDNLLFYMENKVKQAKNSLRLQSEKIINLDPHLPLKKGYSIVKKGDSVIKKGLSLSNGDELKIYFTDSVVKSEVKKIEEKERL